ncbi:hypothetical protein [Streptomyces sp. NPDC058457]|uniref:hypothetical protein n=1 Tax=Streptomyces sp. NPDC058457 TaxID=3346507 RepID=UPI00364B1922
MAARTADALDVLLARAPGTADGVRGEGSGPVHAVLLRPRRWCWTPIAPRTCAPATGMDVMVPPSGWPPTAPALLAARALIADHVRTALRERRSHRGSTPAGRTHRRRDPGVGHGRVRPEHVEEAHNPQDADGD